MKTSSLKQKAGALKTISLAIVFVSLLAHGISFGEVFDADGKPVKLVNILLEAGDPNPACLDDPSQWQDWINYKVGNIDSRYEKVAEKLKKVSGKFDCHGKRIHWQGALIQAILETGYFRFQGDADPENFNIGGVGITLDQRDETGKNVSVKEKFGNLERGIKAYYQHLCVYASGYELENPIAARTKIEQRRIAQEVQPFIQKFKRPITFNDLKASVAPWTKLDKRSKKFKDFAKHYAPPEKPNPSEEEIIEAWETYMRKLDKTGGTTFTWAGDPFYGVKMMSLWAAGTKWVEDRCQLAGGQNADEKKVIWVLKKTELGDAEPDIQDPTTTTRIIYDFKSSESQLEQNWKMLVGKEANRKIKSWKKWTFQFNPPPAKLIAGKEIDPITIKGKFTTGGKWHGASSASYWKLTIDARPLNWLSPSQLVRVGKEKTEDTIIYNLQTPQSNWPDKVWIKFYTAHGSKAFVHWLYEKEK